MEAISDPRSEARSAESSARRGRSVEILRPGQLPFGEALALQERLRDELAEGSRGDTVVLLEHPDVITFGRGAQRDNAPADERLRELGFEVYRTNRGGDVTWHGPGQLIGYPILDLSRRGSDVHVYLRALEAVLIGALSDLGIPAQRREGYAGVWLDEIHKIASIGVGLRGWLTMHGFALNVNCDLSRFDVIVPCGLRGVEMTSIERELGRPVDLAEVSALLESRLRRAFA